MKRLKCGNCLPAGPCHLHRKWPARALLLPSVVCAVALAIAAVGQRTVEAQGVAADDTPAVAGSGPTQPASETKTLVDLDLDQLMNVQVSVTSVSKKEEDSFQAPAAIFVLTAEDIRRGGFNSLPEALRMVPGLYVARGNADSWTIAAPGDSLFRTTTSCWC